MIGNEKCAACGYEGKFTLVLDFNFKSGSSLIWVAAVESGTEQQRLGTIKACPQCGTIKLFAKKEAFPMKTDEGQRLEMLKADWND